MTTSTRKTIAVVDNSPTVMELFERGMQELEIELKAFDSTEEAWPYFKSNKPDLIFLNIKMPGKDGLTILKELRELPLHKDTLVVMISSKDYAQDRSIASDLGALDFITKPMPIKTIRDTVIKHLNIDPS